MNGKEIEMDAVADRGEGHRFGHRRARRERRRPLRRRDDGPAAPEALHRDHPPDPGDRQRASPGPSPSPGRSTSSSSPRTTSSRSSNATCGRRGRSRSSSKVAKTNFIELAVRAMMGAPVRNRKSTLDLNYVGVKAPQFSFSRLKGADPGPRRRDGLDGRGRLPGGGRP